MKISYEYSAIVSLWPTDQDKQGVCMYWTIAYYVVTVIEDIQKTACDSWRNLWDTNAFLSDRLEC